MLGFQTRRRFLMRPYLIQKHRIVADALSSVKDATAADYPAHQPPDFIGRLRHSDKIVLPSSARMNLTGSIGHQPL